MNSTRVNASPAPAFPNLLGYDAAAWRGYFAEMGEADFRARQILRWVHRRGVLEFDAMTDLGKGLRQRLMETARLEPPRLGAACDAADGVRKWQVLLADGAVVETVWIPGPSRNTLCLSTQVGCPLRCDFCATGSRGFTRNLSAAEIIGQFWLVVRELGAFGNIPGPISNVVMMGMGEPLLNLDAVLPVIRLLRDDQSYGLARRRVTISTAGVVPGIRRLAQEYDAYGGCALAVSLHAARDALRDRLVPLNRSYPLERLMQACRDYAQACPGAGLTFEYTLLGGVNDSPRDAHEVAALLRGLPAKINLIPFNPFPGATYRRSESATLEEFQRILRQHGYVTTLRQTRGDDIAAACGQLTGGTPSSVSLPRSEELLYA